MQNQGDWETAKHLSGYITEEEREGGMREAKGHVSAKAASDPNQNGLDPSILVGLKRDWVTRIKIFEHK
jgi:hypothetical protein